MNLLDIIQRSPRPGLTIDKIERRGPFWEDYLCAKEAKE